MGRSLFVSYVQDRCSAPSPIRANAISVQKVPSRVAMALVVVASVDLEIALVPPVSSIQICHTKLGYCTILYFFSLFVFHFCLNCLNICLSTQLLPVVLQLAFLFVHLSLYVKSCC